MQRLAIRIVEVIAFVVDDEIENRAVGQMGLLVDDETPIAYRGAYTHAVSVARRSHAGKRCGRFRGSGGLSPRYAIGVGTRTQLCRTRSNRTG